MSWEHIGNILGTYKNLSRIILECLGTLSMHAENESWTYWDYIWDIGDKSKDFSWIYSENGPTATWLSNVLYSVRHVFGHYASSTAFTSTIFENIEFRL